MAWARVDAVHSEMPQFQSSYTISYTRPTASNALLVVSTAFWDSNSTSTVTYNGVSMTKAYNSDYGEVYHSEIWYLAAPASGTNDVVLTFTGTVADLVVGVSTFSGIDQSTPFRSGSVGYVTTVGTSSTSPYVDVINCVANDLVYGVCIRNGSVLSGADTEDWVEYHDADNVIGAGCYTNGTNGTVQVNWSMTGTVEWATCGVAFIPASDSLATRRTLLGVGV